MPQMNKGGKFIFGASEIRPDGRVQLPPHAVDEYKCINIKITIPYRTVRNAIKV